MLLISYLDEGKKKSRKDRIRMAELMEDAFKKGDSGKSVTGFSAAIFIEICRRERAAFRLTGFPDGSYYVERV